MAFLIFNNSFGIEGCLHAPLDELAFTDRSEELCSSLENSISKNHSLVELNFINLRFAGRIIDCIGKGLRINKTLKTLSIEGNLIDWHDLANLCESLTFNKTLESLDISLNKIVRIRDVAATKGLYMPEILKDVKSTFKNMKKVINRNNMKINDWIFDHMEYPDSVSEYIKDVRPSSLNTEAFSTIVSTSKGEVRKV